MIQWKLDCQKQKEKSQPATTNQPQSLRSKIVISSFYSLADFSFFYVCHLIDDKLYHNIVKVAMELRAAGEWFSSKLW